MRANRERTLFLDNLRVFLTMLVFFHHAAITYGALGDWYWRDPKVVGGLEGAALALTAFCSTNQAYFMGLFFLMAGYFTASSLERKSPKEFLTDRVIRLGIPTLFFALILDRLTLSLVRASEGQDFVGSLLYWFTRPRFNPGPLWFAEALLVFTVGLLVFRALAPNHPARATSSELPRWPILLSVALVVAIVAFAIRLWMPVGNAVAGLQLGYFASYVVLFAAGVGAWPGRLLEIVTWRDALPCVLVGVLILPILPGMAIGMGGVEGVNGGWNVKAALYALWEPFVGLAMIAVLLWGFRAHMNHDFGRMTPWMVGRAYAAYIVHAPILVAVTLAMHSWSLPALAKFVIAGSFAALLSFVTADLLLRIPGLRRIIG